MYSKIPASWKIPEEIRNRFGRKDAGKQRAMFAEGHLLLILHMPPKPEERSRHAVLFWRSPSGEWKSSNGRDGLFPLREHIEEYAKLEEKTNKLYIAASTPDEYFNILETLTPIVRASTNMAIALQQAREAVKDDMDIIDFRDQTQEISREIDILYTDTKNGLDYEVAKRAEQQAQYSLQTSHATDRLNILVALFLPVTAISGLFGMNLINGIENITPVLFWGIIVASFALGFGVKAWVMSPTKEKK
jgi:hypothetical protein